MNKGRIKILFNNAEMQSISIETNKELAETPEWKRLSTWWMQSPTTHGYDTQILPLSDGSVLLLKRSEITFVGLEPRHACEIGSIA